MTKVKMRLVPLLVLGNQGSYARIRPIKDTQ